MLIKKSGNKPNSMNLAVLVTGFTKSSDGAYGVAGTQIPGGDKVEVFLTTRGHSASNPDRYSIETLMNGFKVQRTSYKLEDGGIVVFKGAFKPNGGTAYIAQWANPLAYNTEDAKKYAVVCQNGVLRMFQDQNTGAHRGTFYDYHLDGIFSDKTPDGSGLVAQVAAFYTKTPNASFLVRALDANGEVIGFKSVNKFFVDDGDGATRSMTPEEAGAAVKSAVEQMNAPGGYSVLPAARYPVSPKGLSGDGNGRPKIAAFLAGERAYVTETDAGTDICAKRSFIKLSEPSPNGVVYVNSVFAEDPYGVGVDPLTIGGLRVSASHSSSDAPAAAPAHEEDAGADPFDGVDDGYFDGAPDANTTSSAPGAGR